MAENKVVVHLRTGGLLKGTTRDFFPNKDSFHLEREGSGESTEVKITDLKGVFFVKTFQGDASAGGERTPWILAEIARRTGGASVIANIDLLRRNAELAAEVGALFARFPRI